MVKKKLGPLEERKVVCKSGKEIYLMTRKRDGYFYLYRETPDGYEEVTTKKQVSNPYDFDDIIWPKKRT